jgi:hypothetical protein
MAAYTKTLLEPLVAALERAQGRVAELERENGHLAERLAAAEDRLRAREAPREAPMHAYQTHVAWGTMIPRGTGSPGAGTGSPPDVVPSSGGPPCG